MKAYNNIPTAVISTSILTDLVQIRLVYLLTITLLLIIRQAL